MPTDTERLDFLDKQKYTRWVGYTIPNGNCTWPVFPGEGKLRIEIDRAIEASRRLYESYDNVC